MAYAQTAYTAESYERERQAKQEISDLFSTLQGSQDLIRIKLEILVRNGPTPALNQELDQAAASYGEAFAQILAYAGTAPRLTAPKGNRYG